MNGFRKAALVTAVAVALVLLGTAGAGAVLTVRQGTVSTQHIKVHQTDPVVVTSTAFVDVPRAEATFVIEPGAQGMADARFAGESLCTGTGWCSVRIVVTLPTGVVVELDPASGTDFAFDSADADLAEAHAMERSTAFLGAGTYRIRVQAAVAGGNAQFRLDDWTLVVEVVRPVLS